MSETITDGFMSTMFLVRTGINESILWNTELGD